MNGDRPGILRLGFELFMVPVRTFLHGVERMVETLRDIQQVTDRGADSWLGGPVRDRHLPPARSWPAPAEPADSAPTAGVVTQRSSPEPPIAAPATFREPRMAGSALDGAGKQPSKEDRSMYVDQDLSGDMVKVVQYCIVSVVTSATDEAFVIVPPKVKAFANDMTAEDFTSWMIAENAPGITDFKARYTADQELGLPEPDQDPRWGSPASRRGVGPLPWDRKYLRVAFSVMGRFSPADINWDELQARSVAWIAAHYPPVGLPPAEGPSTGKSTKGGS